MTGRRWPLQPFLDATGWSMTRIREVAPCNGVEYRRRRTEGVTEATADRLAIAAHLHPWEIWPEIEHLAEIPCAECNEGFVPFRKNHLHCSKRCYQRAYKREKYRRLYATDPAFRAAELERSRAKREAAPKATKIKKAAYYRRNRERILAQQKARRAA